MSVHGRQTGSHKLLICLILLYISAAVLLLFFPHCGYVWLKREQHVSLPLYPPPPCFSTKYEIFHLLKVVLPCWAPQCGKIYQYISYINNASVIILTKNIVFSWMTCPLFNEKSSETLTAALLELVFTVSLNISIGKAVLTQLRFCMLGLSCVSAGK